MTRNASTRALPDPALIAALVAHLQPRAAAAQWPLVVGLSGLQGSGKSTLAAQLVAACRAQSINALALSLDDAYFGRRERQRLARTIHPLLMTRGVPGTHSPPLIEQTLDALAYASALAPARLPRFDKGSDTRVAPSRWRRIGCVPQVILFEGWCVGVSAEAASELQRPINRLEREEDAEGRWRGYANACLGDAYARLWQRLDLLIELKAPAFEVVAGWRAQQEQTLRRRDARRAMTPSQLVRFIAHFERISRHALRTLAASADISVALDEHRRVTGVTTRAETDDCANACRAGRWCPWAVCDGRTSDRAARAVTRPIGSREDRVTGRRTKRAD